MPPGGQRVVVFAGHCGIPASAKAVSLNVTVAGAPASGLLTLFPGNATPTATSTINFAAGQTRANNAVLLLASSGSGTLAVLNSSGSAVPLVIDVDGYFQ
jgi:hypothetical protein